MRTANTSNQNAIFARKRAKKSNVPTVVSTEESTESGKRSGGCTIVSVVENRAREVCVAKMDVSNVRNF